MIPSSGDAGRIPMNFSQGDHSPHSCQCVRSGSASSTGERRESAWGVVLVSTSRILLNVFVAKVRRRWVGIVKSNWF